jgi:hypothetical protein
MSNLFRKKSIATVVSALLTSLVTIEANAGNFGEVKQLSQEAFTALAKDLASVTALRALAPGASFNLLGIDVGVETGVTSVDNKAAWQKAGGGSTTVYTPRLTIHRGFSGGFDIGASVGLSSGGGGKTIGLIGRYQMLDAGTFTPSATLRLTGNRDFGNDNISVKTFGADVIVAKPLVVITPYLGAGTVRTDSSAPNTTLSSVTVTRSRLFVGFDTALPFATLSAEAEKSGGATTVSTKLGFKF